MAEVTPRVACMNSEKLRLTALLKKLLEEVGSSVG